MEVEEVQEREKGEKLERVRVNQVTMMKTEMISQKVKQERVMKNLKKMKRTQLTPRTKTKRVQMK